MDQSNRPLRRAVCRHEQGGDAMLVQDRQGILPQRALRYYFRIRREDILGGQVEHLFAVAAQIAVGNHTDQIAILHDAGDPKLSAGHFENDFKHRCIGRNKRQFCRRRASSNLNGLRAVSDRATRVKQLQPFARQSSFPHGGNGKRISKGQHQSRRGCRCNIDGAGFARCRKKQPNICRLHER